MQPGQMATVTGSGAVMMSFPSELPGNGGKPVSLRAVFSFPHMRLDDR